MTAKIQKWGNSQGIRLPKAILENVNMSEGDYVEIVIHDGVIIIKSVAGKRKTIYELFSDYEGDYTPDEIDWGEPEGDEIW